MVSLQAFLLHLLLHCFIMRTLLLFIFVCFLSVSSYVSFAQQTTALSDSISKKEGSSYFKADINYLSNSVYNGRKDTLPVPYVTPTFGYYNKSGFYVESSLSFLTSSYAFRPDLFIIDGGYNFSIGDNLSGSVSANKYFANKQSVSVRSEIKGTIDADFAYNIKNAVKLTAGGSYVFSSGHPDVIVNGGISHTFNFGDDDSWSIEPTFLLNAGSQNYYDSYHKKRTLKTGSRKKKLATQPGITTTTSVISLNPNRFVLLDYELSSPLYYDAKKWGAYFIPTFAIPQNPDTYLTTTTIVRTNRNGISGTPVVRQTQTSEHIENSFYAQVGVYFVIK